MLNLAFTAQLHRYQYPKRVTVARKNYTNIRMEPEEILRLKVEAIPHHKHLHIGLRDLPLLILLKNSSHFYHIFQEGAKGDVHVHTCTRAWMHMCVCMYLRFPMMALDDSVMF